MLAEMPIQNIKGLSEMEAQNILLQDGEYVLPSSQKRSFFKIVFEIFKEPMFLLLVVCGSIYLILGDIREALLLLGFVFIIMGVTIYQKNKTEKALDALKKLSSPRALVIRDGVKKMISGREVVKGDILIITEGERVAADCVLLWELNLSCDEALLTGESIAVRKSSTNDITIKKIRPGGDDLPFIYSGSMVIQGQGVARVIDTGINTEIEKIGKALEKIEEEKTILQKEIAKVVATIFCIAMVLCLLIVFIYGFVKHQWLEGILSGITLAMAMLPEEFPVVLTIFLALGAWRISKHNVLTRKISAVETLGAATILCVDKTGTLTQNIMAIKKIFVKDKYYDAWENKSQPLPEDFHQLIEYGVLASKKDPFDPMEKALKELGYQKLVDTEHLHNWPMAEEYPLSKQLLALSHVWEVAPKEYLISAKGAPEAITDLCHLGKNEIENLNQHINNLAKEGLRVLGVAKAIYKNEVLPQFQHDFDFEFVGLIGLADPIRDTVPYSVEQCYQAGIRVIMITGDYPATAQHIASEIGLKNPEKFITGAELQTLTTEALKEKIKSVNIFARVVPEQKLHIVNALKTSLEIVAMTGDGINDAPALKEAHIGVAMGDRGTDVAREASDIVLLDDNFSSIVAAVRIGRRIFDNLKKAMSYIISVHIPIAGASLIPILFGWPIILFPVHIVFLELVIDPACSIVFESEPEEPNIMARPPRKVNEALINKKGVFLSFLQGIFSLVGVLFVFRIALFLGQSVEEARTLTFITLIVSNLSLILTNRSWQALIVSYRSKAPNKIFPYLLIAVISCLFMILHIPVLREMFHFTDLSILDFAIALAVGILSIVWFEILVVKIRKFDLLS